jgi:pentatricopeptide repeat protein
MEEKGIKPDKITFISVLNGFSHIGYAKECIELYYLMEKKYNIKPSIEHKGCVVDALSRIGKLDEAENFIEKEIKEEEVDLQIYTALLGGCRIHGDLKRGERIFKKIQEMNPNDDSYVLMGNIYLISGFYDKAMELRELMKEKGIKKIPGKTWGYLNEKMISFLADDRSHPDWLIYHKGSIDLTKEIMEIGYEPFFDHILQPISDNEEKIHHLCTHSERLLFTYLHMNTPPNEELIMFKNLRICPDCHNAFKYLSKLTKRRIIMRDTNRFHHFENGNCSCKDHF